MLAQGFGSHATPMVGVRLCKALKPLNNMRWRQWHATAAHAWMVVSWPPLRTITGSQHNPVATAKRLRPMGNARLATVSKLWHRRIWPTLPFGHSCKWLWPVQITARPCTTYPVAPFHICTVICLSLSNIWATLIGPGQCQCDRYSIIPHRSLSLQAMLS